jgi:amino acid adenylation domain-containing protein
MSNTSSSIPQLNVSLEERATALSPAKRALLELKRKNAQAQAVSSLSIPRRIQAGHGVLSYAQQRLWFLNQLQPENPFYNCPLALRLRGRVEVWALERGVEEVVRRHEVLRTRIVSVDGKPEQVIEEEVKLQLAVEEVSGQEEAERVCREEALRPFDLSRGPLLRVRLLQVADDEHVLLMTMHHIVSDGWSWGVFLGELGRLYEGYVSGQDVKLTEPAIQYGDFAEWQREWLQGEVLEEQLRYWREQLQGMEMLQLPTDRVRPAEQSYRGGERVMVLSKELSIGLKRLSQREGGTLFMVALAGFQALLKRYTRQEEISVATAIANRNREETEGLIGFFVNTLVMRTDVSGDVSFEELVRRVKGVALGAYGHQDLPFEKLVEELQPERSMSRNPLVQVMFVVQNAPIPEIRLPGLSLVTMEVPTTRFDLEVHMWEVGEQVVVRFIYSRDLFEEETVERMMRHYERVLEAGVRNPEEKIARLPLMNEQEREQVLVEWNRTQREYARNSSVAEVFAEQARKSAERVAVVCEGEAISYGELNRRANQLGRYLRKKGVGPEVLVGIAMERSVEMVVGVLGILKAGGAYVPLDVEYPKERLRYMLGDTGVKVLLSQRRLAGSLPEYDGEVVCVDEEREKGKIAEESSEGLESGAGGENLAYVMYTSGSTGIPKGIGIPHRAVVRLVNNNQYAELGSEQVILQLAPISFDASTFEIWGALLNGGRLVVYPPETPSLEELGRVLAENGVNTLWLTAGLFHMMVDEHVEGLGPVRQLLAGGDVLSPAHVSRVLRELPGCEVINGYGPTENTTFTTCYRMKEESEVGSSVPIGRAIANTQVYVLDGEMEPVPVGVVGELYVGGDGLARGYWKQPELTAEKFIANPYGEGKLYRTGDLVRYRRDGNLEFMGRADQQVKIRGYRIEPGEIEGVLSEHPGVRGCAVVAREQQGGGSGSEKQLVGYVAMEPGYRGQGSRPPQEEGREQVEQWKELYEETYGRGVQEEVGGDATFNITGWKSSYTGEGVGAEQMGEWLEDTVGEILSYQPKRVLEIGCGTGMLLFRIAPKCEAYWATDFSPVVLEYVREHVKEIEGGGKQVHLLERAAEDFTGWEGEKFDTIILNSVVQYFPSMEYLGGVLRQAVERLAPGGRIFVGDVRSLPLLKTFHTGVQLYRAAGTMTVKQLRQRVQMEMRNEEELVIDPGFFRGIREEWEEIERVEVRPKRGRARNELTQYRYQVMMQVRGEGYRSCAVRTESSSGVEWRDWQREGMTVEGLRRLLEGSEPDFVGLVNVGNGRVWEWVKAAELLEGEEEEEGTTTVEELRGHLGRMGKLGVEVEELFELEKELPYRVEIGWGRHGEDGSYDVLLRRRRSGSEDEIRVGDFPEGKATPRKAWREYGNDPMRRKVKRELIPELREYLKERLPEYMVPGVWVVLEELPLTANGKVDRRGLPEPEGMRPELESGYEEPGTETEKKLAEIWGEVLGVERVGVHDNFFDLGGHSLLATQVVSRIREGLGITLPLQTMFELPTIAEFAVAATSHLQQREEAEERRVASILRRIEGLDDMEVEMELRKRMGALHSA